MKDENYLGNYYGDKFHDGYDGAVYKPNGITPTLRARNAGGVFIAVKKVVKDERILQLSNGTRLE